MWLITEPTCSGYGHECGHVSLGDDRTNEESKSNEESSRRSENHLWQKRVYR